MTNYVRHKTFDQKADAIITLVGTWLLLLIVNST